MTPPRVKSFQPRSPEPDLMLEINTTPLIDVMLVLLIMLIITVPTQHHAAELQLPPPAVTPPNKPNPETVDLRLDASDRLWWNDVPLQDRTDLRQHLKNIAAQNPQPPIHLRAEMESTYANVAMILSLAQNLGVHDLGIDLAQTF